MDDTEEHVPTVFSLAHMEWVDSKATPDPEHLTKWERSLAGLGLEVQDSRSVSCSVTYPDGGGPTCDDHGLVGTFAVRRDAASIPAVIVVQPHRERVIRSPADLVRWEEEMAKVYGLRRIGNTVASATDTETRPDAGPGLGDCDVKSDGVSSRR
jgi:hypothetical protein